MRRASLAITLFVAFGPGAAAQGIWAPLTLSNPPAPRFGGAMAYDRARDRLVLVGGQASAISNVQETWEHDGSQWLFRGAIGPTGELGDVAAVYDEVRHVVVGLQHTNPFNQVQVSEWNGTTWTQIGTVPAPGTRRGFALAYDSARGVTVLFGGRNGSTLYAETWEWNGTFWLQRGNGGPLPRVNAGMAYDAGRGVTVLFGGYDNVLMQEYGDTWEWDGAQWVSYFGVPGPLPRYEHAMTYDGLRQRVVLVGGRTHAGTEYQQTWEWNGQAWMNTLAPAPSASGPAVAFDSLRQRTESFGGRTLSGVVQGGDSVYTATAVAAAVVPYGSACPGPTGDPTLTVLIGAPRLGSTLTLRIGNLPAGALNLPLGWLGFDAVQWNGLPLPLSLTPLGFPNCEALVAPAVTYAFANSGGSTNWPLAVPFLPAFAGQQFFVQAGVLVLGFNPGGIVFSAGLAATIGH